MIKLGITGCTGKLGNSIIQQIKQHKNIELAVAVTRKGNCLVGEKIANTQVIIEDDLSALQKSNVIIDCTNAISFRQNIQIYKALEKPLVIATTGFSDLDMEKIAELSKNIPIIISGNFSIALFNFLMAVRSYAAGISHDTDITIIELHHKTKKDAPSGTAKMIRKAIIEANPCIQEQEITIQSVRAGSIFGEHQVIFATNSDEVITMKHSVSSRKSFSDGALWVAEWIYNQCPQLYTMYDFIKATRG